jgi:hypothetical protein
MKLLLLAGTAFLGLAAAGSAVRAVPFDFTYTGSLVTFTVPSTGTYQILAFGAQGGNSGAISDGIGVGGSGAEIGGDFSLTAGEVLQIAVGGAGMSVVTPGRGGGSGGGGSFVVGPGNTPLVIAGGGGGGGEFAGGNTPGGGGLTGPDGGSTSPQFPGGTGGSGGAGVPSGGGGGGGGFFSAGGGGFFSGGFGGGGFPDLTGGMGVANGGFGGGGGQRAAPAVVAATAVAQEASSAPAVMVQVVAAAPSTRAQTRSWSPIFKPATARS